LWAVFACIFVLAGIPACDDLQPGDYEMHRFGETATIIVYAVPDYDVSQADKDDHPGAVPFDMYLFVDPTPEGIDDTSDPPVAAFPFLSDGKQFTQLVGMSVENAGDPSSAGGDGADTDGYGGYASWIELPEDEAASAEGVSTWIRQFALDKATSESVTSTIGPGRPAITLGGDPNFGWRVDLDLPLWGNESTVSWDPDPEAETNLFYVPIAMIATIVVDPELFQDVPLPEGMIPADPSPWDPGEFATIVGEANLGPTVLAEPDLSQFALPDSYIDGDGILYNPSAFEETEEEFRARMGDFFGSAVLAAPVAATNPDESFEWLERLPPIFCVVWDDLGQGKSSSAGNQTEGDSASPLPVPFQLSDQLPEGLIVHNIPVPGELLFDPPEPHTVMLPYTFWTTIEPIGLTPLEEVPGDLNRDPELLRVIVSPATGGAVTVSTAEWTQLPSGPAEGNWEGALAFDYTLEAGELTTEVTLSAEPAEGYRFVAWQTEDSHARIDDATSATTRLSIHPVTSGQWELTLTTVVAYFAPYTYTGEPPEDWFPESMMGATIKPVSHTIEDESGCRSTVDISYDVVDLTGGQQLIEYVQLNIDGDELTSWTGTPTDRYHNDMPIASDCSEVRVISLKAVNSEGQTMNLTREANIPPLRTHFDYDIQDGPEGGTCKKQLVMDLEAIDLTVAGNPIVHVVVTGNGSTWHDSGSISTDSYEHSFSGLVTCGGTYMIDVFATDSDGNTYSYRETIRVPDEEPPEEEEDEGPPPPATTTLYGAMAASASCTSSGGECSCQLTVSVDAEDLTGGTYPVTSVVLAVNGQVWHDSGGISTTQYHQVVTKTVGCGATFNLELTAENSIDQTGSTTGSFTTPIP